MQNEHLIIEIEGAEAEDLYPRLVQLEVEHDLEMAGMFRLSISLIRDLSGTWLLLDDERLTPWKEVRIGVRFGGTEEELVTGYITHVKPTFTADPGECLLAIWGMDKSVLMDRQEQLKDWPNKKDSDIAREIISGYGLTPEVDDTEVIHDEALSTIIQRETDLRFLRRLALRNGCELYLAGERVCFKNPALSEPPQPVLAVHFGAETTVTAFSLSVNGLEPANVAMAAIDRMTKEVLETEVTATSQPPLGSRGGPDLLGPGMDPGRVVVSRTAATGLPEMTALSQGAYDRGTWFVNGEGEVAVNQYGHILTVRGTVSVKGIGETHSGLYYLTRVVHSFTEDGFRQYFEVKRNALQPLGSEDFG